MDCLDRFKYKMSQQYGNLHRENIHNSKALVEEVFKDDSSYFETIYKWKLGFTENSYKNENPIDIRIYKRDFTDSDGITAKYQSLIETSTQIGDIYYDTNTKDYWIVKTAFNIDGIHWQGEINRCNWILKFQKKTGEILEYPCYVRNRTLYNSGETTTKLMTVGSANMDILLPYDENTVSIQTPQRFYLDKDTVNPMTYEVTSNDTLTYNYDGKGIIVVSVKECAEDHETDRPDLGICDYIDPTAENNSGNQSGNISDDTHIEIVCNTNKIKSGGNEQVFTAQLIRDKQVVNDFTANWEIVCSFIDELEVKKAGNSIYISIDNDNYIDEDFKLKVTDDKDQYQAEIIITVDSLL